MVLASYSKCNGNNTPCLSSWTEDEERMRSGYWLWSVVWVSFSALTLMVGWWEGHLARDNLCQLSPKICFQNNRRRNCSRRKPTITVQPRFTWKMLMVVSKVRWINKCHSTVLLVVKDYTQLKESWRCICCVAGHYLDQKRLKQGLYRHPWDDISYVMPEKFNQWFRVKNNFVVIHQGFKNMFHHCLMVFLGRSLPIITACFFLFQNDVCSVFTLLP